MKYLFKLIRFLLSLYTNAVDSIVETLYEIWQEVCRHKWQTAVGIAIMIGFAIFMWTIPFAQPVPEPICLPLDQGGCAFI